MTVEIPLSTKGYVTLVDDEDAHMVQTARWCAHKNGKNKQKVYVQGKVRVDGRLVNVYLHRWLLDAPSGMDVDHINGDPLDNRRNNLRLATRAQNCANTPPRAGEFKGVHWHPYAGRWCARMNDGQKNRSLGYFTNPEDAARAYDAAAWEAFGEFAFLNFPETYIRRILDILNQETT